MGQNRNCSFDAYIYINININIYIYIYKPFNILCYSTGNDNIQYQAGLEKQVNAYITQTMVKGGIVLIFIKDRISYSLHQDAKRHNTF